MLDKITPITTQSKMMGFRYLFRVTLMLTSFLFLERRESFPPWPRYSLSLLISESMVFSRL